MKKNASRIQQATNEGVATMAGHALPCAVLPDGTRVVAVCGIADALSHKDKFPALLEKLRPHLPPTIDAALSRPLRYRDTFGGVFEAVDARHLSELLSAVLSAEHAGAVSAEIAGVATELMFDAVMAGWARLMAQAREQAERPVTLH